MSAAGSTFIGIIGSVIFLLAVFSFSQRNWKGGCLWLLVGAGVIVLLTYLDKPSGSAVRVSSILNGDFQPATGCW